MNSPELHFCYHHNKRVKSVSDLANELTILIAERLLSITGAVSNSEETQMSLVRSFKIQYSDQLQSKSLQKVIEAKFDLFNAC